MYCHSNDSDVFPGNLVWFGEVLNVMNLQANHAGRMCLVDLLVAGLRAATDAADSVPPAFADTATLPDFESVEGDAGAAGGFE